MGWRPIYGVGASSNWRSAPAGAFHGDEQVLDVVSTVSLRAFWFPIGTGPTRLYIAGKREELHGRPGPVVYRNRGTYAALIPMAKASWLRTGQSATFQTATSGPQGWQAIMVLIGDAGRGI